MSAKPSRRHNPLDRNSRLFLCQEIRIWTYFPLKMNCVACDSGFACACGPDLFCETNMSQFHSVCSQSPPLSDGHGCLWRGFWSLLSPFSFTYSHTSHRGRLWWRRGEQSSPWVCLSAGLDVAQIVELDVKWRAGTVRHRWQELWCLSLSSVVLMRVESAVLHRRRSAGCKLTVIEETCIRRCTVAQLIGRGMH